MAPSDRVADISVKTYSIFLFYFLVRHLKSVNNFLSESKPVNSFVSESKSVNSFVSESKSVNNFLSESKSVNTTRA